MKLTFEANDLSLMEARESINKVFFRSFADVLNIILELFVPCIGKMLGRFRFF